MPVVSTLFEKGKTRVRTDNYIFLSLMMSGCDNCEYAEHTHAHYVIRTQPRIDNIYSKIFNHKPIDYFWMVLPASEI